MVRTTDMTAPSPRIDSRPNPRTKLRIPGAVVAALALLVTARSAAAEWIISGSFSMNSHVGDASSLEAIIGNENTWEVVLEGTTTTTDTGGFDPFEESTVLRIIPESFSMTFYGPDADLLNSEVAAYLTRGGNSGGAILELTNEHGTTRAYFYVFPDNTSTHVYFSQSAYLENYPVDGDGYPMLDEFETANSYPTFYDPRNGFANVYSTLAGNNLAMTRVEPAPACVAIDNGDGSYTIDCHDGGSITISDGVDGSSCSVANNGDGTYTISCEDGTSVVVSDGHDGEDGMQGEDGSSCSVANNGDGTYTISCEDGTSIVLSDGEGGANGTDGQDGADGRSCSVRSNPDGSATIECTDGTSARLQPPKAVGGCASAHASPIQAFALALVVALVRRRRRCGGNARVAP